MATRDSIIATLGDMSDTLERIEAVAFLVSEVFGGDDDVGREHAAHLTLYYSVVQPLGEFTKSLDRFRTQLSKETKAAPKARAAKKPRPATKEAQGASKPQ